VTGVKIVITGGPGAGKTAVLETASRHFGERIRVLPESASILFRGGFPRRRSEPARRAIQRAIFHVQSELEQMCHEERADDVLLCDRGTIDGVAYWPDDEASFYRELGTTPEEQHARYHTVIHLRVPAADDGYFRNGTRIETAEEAADIDQRIAQVWAGHPRRIFVESTHDFVEKVQATLRLLRELVPARSHATEG